MVNAAVIRDGVVVNRVVAPSEEFAQEKGWVVSESAKLGDSLDEETGEFTSPAPDPTPVPRSVTKRQAKEALIRQGNYQAALAVLDSIADATEKAIAKNYWSESQEFQRNNPVLTGLAISGLSMTEQELDDLFRYAATL